MKLNDKTRHLIATFPLGFVATVTADGHPHLSPKGTFLVLDDTTIAFGEIRSPGTMANLEHQPEVEVNFIDQWTRSGIRIRGATRKLTRGSLDFAALIGRWHDVWGELASRINALVLIDVMAVRPLTSPPYDDGVTEAEMIAQYRVKFAEIYP